MLLRKISGFILPSTTRNIVQVATASTVCALIVRALIDPILPVGVPYFTLWIAVDVATVMAGWRAGVAVIVVGAVAGWYAWLPPRYAFEVKPNSMSVVVIFVLLAALQALLAELMREALIRLERADRARELAGR